jgi:hypothetical protein
MSDIEPATGTSQSNNYRSARFAADLEPLTIDQVQLVERYLAEPEARTYWTPLARRALMESRVRSRIEPDNMQSAVDAVKRGELAPVLPIDNRTPYFPASKPWTKKCTAVIRERVELTIRKLGTRALILTEKMALYVGDFAEIMQDRSIADYFDEVGTMSIDGALAAFIDQLAGQEAGSLTLAIIRREYGEFRPVGNAQAAEFRGGPRAVDQPGIKELMETRRIAHAQFDSDFRALGINLSALLEKELRRLYPWGKTAR